MRPEIFRLAKVDRTTQGVLQQEAGISHADQRKRAAGFDFDGDVHIAVWPVIATGYRTEHGKVTDAAPPQFRFRGSQSTPHFVKHPRRHEVRP